jgi:nucleoside-diphosphate-sugar epimerase
MRVLITGATGFLGRTLVVAFRAAGHATLAFSRHASASGLPGELVDGDIRDATALARAADGCDAICHSAALVSIWRKRREEFDEVNVHGLENVLDIVRATGLSRLVYTSSYLALPPPGADVPGRWNDYQRTKVAAEKVADRAVIEGIPLIRTYPGVVYGPGPITEGNLVGRMLADHLAGRLPAIVGAGCMRSYAWIEDVAAAHVAACERGRPAARYMLGGENVPQMRVFEIVRELTGRRLPRRLPVRLATLVGAIQEVRAAMTGRPPALTAGTVEILASDWPLDSNLAVSDLGYRITPLRDGLARVIDGLRPPGPTRGTGPRP